MDNNELKIKLGRDEVLTVGNHLSTGGMSIEIAMPWKHVKVHLNNEQAEQVRKYLLGEAANAA